MSTWDPDDGDLPLADTWFTGATINHEAIQANLTDPLNTLGARVAETDWTNLTGYASGYGAWNGMTGGFGHAPMWKIIGGNRVRMRGIIGKSSGNFPDGASTTIFASLPSDIVPTAQVEYGGAATQLAGCTSATVAITSGGALRVVLISGSTAQWVSLDGLEYDLS